VRIGSFLLAAATTVVAVLGVALFAGELVFFGTEAISRLAGEDSPAALYAAFGLGVGVLLLPNVLPRPASRRRK